MMYRSELSEFLSISNAVNAVKAAHNDKNESFMLNVIDKNKSIGKNTGFSTTN